MPVLSTRARRAVAMAVASVVIGTAAVAVGPSATAEPSRSIEQVRDQLRALEDKAGEAAEAYSGAQEKLRDLKRETEKASEQVSQARREVSQTESVIGAIAATAYQSGGLDTSLQVLLADDPQEFITKAAALDMVAADQAAALRDSATARLRYAQAEAKLTERTAAQKDVVAELAQRKAEIDKAVAEKEQYLAQLKEEERQRLAALAAQEASSSSAAAVVALSNVPASGRGAIAVRAALAQVGEPYTYNAQPPNSWDCSKLTAWAWGQAGVSLVAYSFTQASQVQRVSTSALQPGDLLFYFNGAHHVAMYIGGGQIVEAASPSSGVRVTSLWNSWNSAHFSFAGRPV